MRYILASKSPRRKELMKIISSDFLIAVEDIDEDSSYKLAPIEAVKDIAKRKGEAVDKYYPNDLVISADTIVVIDNQIIGKPKDKEDAKRILRMLSNKSHYVYTAYRLKYLNKELINIVASEVIFNELNEDLIDKYVASGSPLDKAGAYGVQDNDVYPIIKKVIGSVDNVIGFPVKEIKVDIEKLISSCD